MITGFLINAFYILLYNIINLFPNGNGLPSGINTSIQFLSTSLHAYDYFFPISTTIYLLILSIAIEATYWGVQFYFWLIRIIRGA
jgi:hypothetical protein